jgi:hypothetical protein
VSTPSLATNLGLRCGDIGAHHGGDAALDDQLDEALPALGGRGVGLGVGLLGRRLLALVRGGGLGGGLALDGWHGAVR